VGELIKLEAGKKIPVDALLVDGSEVRVDESNITGEPEEVQKESYERCLEI